MPELEGVLLSFLCVCGVRSNMKKNLASYSFTFFCIENNLEFVFSNVKKKGLAFAEAENADEASKIFYYNQIIEAMNQLWGVNGEVVVEGEEDKEGKGKRRVLELLSAATDADFHYHLYDWMLKRKLDDQLLSMRTPYLERYLKAIGDQQRVELQRLPLELDSFAQAKRKLDLLWRYYSFSNQHYLAAQCLFELADMTSSSFGLELRFQYLSTSKMHAESCVIEGREGVKGEDRLLNELRDRVDVANIQFAMYCELRGRTEAMERRERREREREERGGETAESTRKKMKELDAELKTLQELFDHYARPLKLYECQLMILKCANYEDRAMIEKTWEKIFEFRSVASLQTLVVDFGKKYYPSEVVFPLQWICRNLQKKGVLNVVELLTRVGVPFHVMFFGVYDTILRRAHEEVDEAVALDLLKQWIEVIRLGLADTKDHLVPFLFQVSSNLEFYLPRLMRKKEFKLYRDQFEELAGSFK